MVQSGLNGGDGFTLMHACLMLCRRVLRLTSC
jgi:hypothetical protein